jgi:hypothetical protein
MVFSVDVCVLAGTRAMDPALAVPLLDPQKFEEPPLSLMIIDVVVPGIVEPPLLVMLYLNDIAAVRFASVSVTRYAVPL